MGGRVYAHQEQAARGQPAPEDAPAGVPDPPYCETRQRQEEGEPRARVGEAAIRPGSVTMSSATSAAPSSATKISRQLRARVAGPIG